MCKKIVTKQFIVDIWNEYGKACSKHFTEDIIDVENVDKGANQTNMNSFREMSFEEISLYGRKNGWLEEQDVLSANLPLSRKTAARIVHEFLRRQCMEYDEIDWHASEKLKDLYDCHVCVAHVAQVYVKGIIKSREKDVFGMNDEIDSCEEKTIIVRMFYPKERIIVFENNKEDNTKDRPVVNASGDKIINLSFDSVSIELNKADIILVDVRVPSEYEKNHLSEAINIPMMRFVDNSYKNMLIDTNKKILLYCEGGYQSEIAAGVLKKAGYDAISFAMK